MSVSMKVDLTKFKLKVNELKTVKSVVAPQIYQHFKDITPIRTGNARNNTYLNNGDIMANYAYAEKLDEGYSRQAPAGMTKPTEEFAKRLIPKVIQQIVGRRK